MKIPKKFKLFNTVVDVIFNDSKCNEERAFGISDNVKSEITLCNVYAGKNLSKDVVLDTLYHERTHQILDAMGEYELSKNEKFVDIFSKLQRQADETAIF